MFTAIGKIFAPKVLSQSIAGVAFTHDEAEQLTQTCSALQQALNLQLSAIVALPDIHNARVSTPIHNIQRRHAKIQDQLASIVSKTHTSNLSWVQEFVDAQSALEGKIVTINRLCRRVGWMDASRRNWPSIAETYELLLPLAAKLHEELGQKLEQEELWTTEGSKQTSGSTATQPEQPPPLDPDNLHVHFGRKVMVREFQGKNPTSQPADGTERSYSVRLTDDRKRTRRSGDNTSVLGLLADTVSGFQG